ncbi:MAG: Methyltransferase domain protein [Firmicutes bacterium ADurb.Bin456]|nr:MAG: Methyltransferase domain protein [Firmicutes bacterium ADurb.Bin456]
MDDVEAFFNENVDFYGRKGHVSYDDYFLTFLRVRDNLNLNLLDIGGGAGAFAEQVVNTCPNISVTVLDPTERLLDLIDDNRIIKVKGKLPNLNPINSKFDYIHVKEVFHHITGSSVNSSKELLRESLFAIKKSLKDNGFLLINELFYESYLIPSYSRNLIFYLLRLQNKLGIKIPAKEFLLGLNVCFYSRSEFTTILNNCGFEVVDYYEEKWADTYKKKALFLKDWGRMLFILKKCG